MEKPSARMAQGPSEHRRLKCHGRIEGGGNVNGPGNKIDGARLIHYDAFRQEVTVCVDHSTIPEFWLELHIPINELQRVVDEGEREAAEQETQRQQEGHRHPTKHVNT